MIPEKVNLRDKLALFDERFSPKIVASLNDYKVQLGSTAADPEREDPADGITRQDVLGALIRRGIRVPAVPLPQRYYGTAVYGQT